MFAPGQRVGVAVSGGPDSVCLLHILHGLAPRWALSLSVIHLDHMLREEASAADSAFVAELAARYALPFHLERTDIRKLAEETGDNLEQAARTARQRFFVRLLESSAIDRVATGHTRSDQAETVLFRFLRGSGTAGLAGILPVTSEGIVRPFLDLTREEILSFLAGRGESWREDTTNSDISYARNRIRHHLLPTLIQEWNPALPETLAHTAELAREEEEYWAAEIPRISQAEIERRGPVLLANAERLRSLPRAVERRLIRYWIQQVKGNLRQIEFLHIEAILLLAAQPKGHGRLQVPGVDVYRSFEWLRFAPPGIDTLANRNYSFELPVPGRVEIPPASLAVETEVIENTKSSSLPSGEGICGYNIEESVLDWDRVTGPLVLRNWRPGDHYRRVGHANEEKIKSLFQQSRVPLWERRHWPVITRGDNVIWARKFGAAEVCSAGEASRKLLRVRVVPAIL